MSRALASVLLVSLLACGGSGGPSSGPGSDSSLAGTWDVVATGRYSGQTTGVVTLDANNLVVSFGSSTLTYHLGDFTFHWSGNSVADIPTQRTAAAMDTGALAFPLGGAWAFTSPTEPTQNCRAIMGPVSITAQCHVGYDLSGETPLDGDMDGSLNGTKGLSTSSIFGDLGGVWTFTDASGATFGTLTFSGSTITVNVLDHSELRGNFTITFGAGSALGSSDSGIEVSARRR